jgi:hypothetical protein
MIGSGGQANSATSGTIKSVGQTRAVGARVCDPQQFRQAERLGRNGTVRLSEVLRLTEPYSPTLLIALGHLAPPSLGPILIGHFSSLHESAYRNERRRLHARGMIKPLGKFFLYFPGHNCLYES